MDNTIDELIKFKYYKKYFEDLRGEELQVVGWLSGESVPLDALIDDADSWSSSMAKSKFTEDKYKKSTKNERKELIKLKKFGFIRGMAPWDEGMIRYSASGFWVERLYVSCDSDIWLEVLDTSDPKNLRVNNGILQYHDQDAGIWQPCSYSIKRFKLIDYGILEEIE